MTFKKTEMAKTLKNGLIMIETNPLNHNWSHFLILSGLTLHQFQKKLLLSAVASIIKKHTLIFSINKEVACKLNEEEEKINAFDLDSRDPSDVIIF